MDDSRRTTEEERDVPVIQVDEKEASREEPSVAARNIRKAASGRTTTRASWYQTGSERGRAAPTIFHHFVTDVRSCAATTSRSRWSGSWTDNVTDEDA